MLERCAFVAVHRYPIFGKYDFTPCMAYIRHGFSMLFQDIGDIATSKTNPKYIYTMCLVLVLVDGNTP